MRIIAGSAKGRRIKVPPGSLRPLSDQAREALFNILAAKTPESNFLDIFAGSGSVGLEALSRGAKLAFFVEKDRRSALVIRQNLADLGFIDKAETYSLEAKQALKIFQKNGAKFDIIFIGAPYGSPELSRSLAYLGGSDLLNPNGIIIAEHRFKSLLKDNFGTLVKFREERYGDTVFSFYKVES
ncbi:16S rRNA (guanine(966)-N(2))-methyltransferase RsmD [Candidatus Saganbacteria bacterium]|nr:16S rRNA (guanine(966)-N(2))-methyltransferase RsmD [Candidatus Saganbacteria bacterium]